MLKRGMIVITSFPGDYGKPRPSLVVQNNDIIEDADSIVLAPLTSHLKGYSPVRVRINPTQENGLVCASDIMIDKISGTKKSRIGETIGVVDSKTMFVVDTSLATLLNLKISM